MFGGYNLFLFLAVPLTPPSSTPPLSFLPFLLPFIFLDNNFTARDIRDMDLSSSGGVTHTYFSGPVLFPFAYGLSFTSYTFNAAWEEGEREGVLLTGGEILPPPPLQSSPQ